MVNAANVISLVLLVHELLQGQKAIKGTPLLFSSILI